MDIGKVKELIKAVSDSDLTSFQVKEDNLEIVLSKNDNEVGLVANQGASSTVNVSERTNLFEGNNTSSKDSGAAQDDNADSVTAQDNNADSVAEVKTPLVGTVYLAPGEGEEPFVKVGDKVKKGQVVAIVEAMKLMNEISCESDGTVSEILVENAQLVEYGQSLITIA